MSTSKYNIYLSCLFIFASFGIVAQPIKPSNEYKHFTTDDGLSNNLTTSLLQDQYGFIWIGTANGLNRFDGYHFIHYNNIAGDTNSISDNYINSIILSREGFIWIATNNGLNCYDPKTETFKQFRHKDGNANSISNNKVSSVYEDEAGYLWIGAFQTLDQFDPLTGTFTHYNPPPIAIADESLDIRNMIAYDNDLFISVWGAGVYRFNRKTHQFRSIKIVHKKTRSKNWLHNFYIDKKNNLLGTDGDFMRFDRATNSFYLVNEASKNNENISADCVAEINPGKYLTSAGDNDFYIYSADFKFESSHLLDKHSGSNISNHLMNLLVTKTGEVWFGAFMNGLYVWDTNRKKFDAYKNEPGDINSIAAGAVSGICNMQSGNIWLGSRINGISIFDPRSQSFHHIYQQKNGLNSPFVQTIFEDRQGNKWIGTWSGGLNKIDAKTGKFSYFKAGNDASTSLLDNFVSAICQSQDDKIWVATTRGVSMIDTKRKKIAIESFVYEHGSNKCPSGLRTDVLLCDHTGAIWIGTDANGLNRYNPLAKTFDYFEYDFNDTKSLASNKVTALFEDSKNRLWIGCSGGLNLFVPEKGSFIHYNEKDGLPGNEIKGVTEDKNSMLWISTDKGLSRFDTKTNSFQNYNTEDGLLSNQFYVQAICKNPQDDKIYAGTIDGLVGFHPDSIISNKFIPPVYISSLKVYQTTGNKTNIEYVPAIQHLNHIELAYNKNTFTLNFLSLSYSNSEKNQYTYKFEGLNNDWVSLGTTREVTFSNLRPGTYLLHVKGSNGDGIWNEKGAMLSIIILPPWWLTWWACTCYTLVVAVFIYAYIRLRIKRGIKKIIEQQALRTKISSDLHDDVGGILSGLAMQSQMLTFTAKEEQKESLHEISNMSREAMEHMRDTVWAIDSRKDKFENLIDRMRAFAEKNLAMKNMTHEFIITDIDTKKFIDPEKRQAIYLIFKEATTNIIKHCDGKHVIISLAYEKNSLHLMIKDNGSKIEDCNSDGLGMSNMKMRAEKIGGLLSVRYDNGFEVELRVP